MRVGETVWNTLKGGGIKKRAGETKLLKVRGKLGQGLGALKRWGWNPLTNFDKWPYLKYFKTCTVNLVIPRLNLQSFTISKKSKVTIWHFCQITWLVPNSFVTWFRFNQWGGVVAYSGYRGTLENWTVLKKSTVCFVIITRNKISWFMKKN